MLRVQIHVEKDGFQEKLDKLDQLLAEGFVLDEAASFLLNRIRTRFLSEVDPDGKPWIPSQAAIRRRSRGGTGTLFDTGTLFRSLQAAGDGPNTRFIGTDVSYARYHQVPNAKHIHRPFLGVNEDDARILEVLLSRRLSDALGD